MLKIVRRLADEGQIVLAGGGDDRFIPREELDAALLGVEAGRRFRRRRAPARHQGCAAPGGRRRRAGAAPAPAATRPSGRPRSQAARQAGYQDGYRDGLVALESFKKSFASRPRPDGALLQAWTPSLPAARAASPPAVARTATAAGAPGGAQRTAVAPAWWPTVAREAVERRAAVGAPHHRARAPAGPAAGGRGRAGSAGRPRRPPDRRPDGERGGCRVESTPVPSTPRWHRHALGAGRRTMAPTARPAMNPGTTRPEGEPA
jgi:flagellar assembly protein FliH